MCLGVPGKIVSVNGLVATVDFFGVQKQVNLHIVDEPVVVGDYILNHVGYAIRKIPLEDVEGTVAMYRELIDGKPEDLMRQDIEGEMQVLPLPAVAGRAPGGDGVGRRRGAG